MVVIPKSRYHENDRGVLGDLREAMDGEITKSEGIRSFDIVRSKAAEVPTLWSCGTGKQTSRLKFVSVKVEKHVRKLQLKEVLAPPGTVRKCRTSGPEQRRGTKDKQVFPISP